MLLATPARGMHDPLCVIPRDSPPQFQALSKATPGPFVLTENDLASRWRMSPRTLQRWRTEGRGPHYLKMGRRVNYPVNAVIAYELVIQHESTSQKSFTQGIQV